MELNENRSSEAVKAIEFTDRKVGGLVLRHIDKGEDIILQLNKGSTSLPDHSGAMMAKDMKLAQDAAISSGQKTELADSALQMYERFLAEGGSSKDFSAIYNMINNSS